MKKLNKTKAIEKANIALEKRMLNEDISSDGGTTTNDLEFLYNEFKKGMINAEKNMNNPLGEQERMFQKGVYSAYNNVVTTMHQYIHGNSGDAVGPGEHGDVDGQY